MTNRISISRVNRSKGEAENFYDRVSRYYDWIGGLFEREAAVKALEYLKIQNGEKVLEIGFGTGYCMQRIARLVGNNGKAFGIDISRGMIRKARKRLADISLLSRAELCQGDAAKLPFDAKVFDAIFLSFTLELFDNPEIPMVLGEIRRVLKSDGRLGIVSLSKTKGTSFSIKVYEWLHNKLPKYIDCRPIYVARTIEQAGYRIIRRNDVRLVVLPVEIIIAIEEPN